MAERSTTAETPPVAAEVDQVASALRLSGTTARGLSSGEHLFALEPTSHPRLTLTAGSHRTTTGFGWLASEWWLQLLGALRQLGQLFGAALLARVVAAALAGALRHRVGEADKRFRVLADRGGRCSWHVILPSRMGSRSPLGEALSTFHGWSLASVASCARDCAAHARTRPLWRARLIARL